MVAAAWTGAQDADVILLVIDAAAGIKSDVERIIAALGDRKRPLLLVLNKIDIVKKPELLALSANLTDRLKPEHTFMVSAASGDGVADTPREAHPQFDCPINADTCTAPGKDPIHNFMDYSQDSCMNMFTQGQADRMSDAWQQFRAGGGKS